MNFDVKLCRYSHAAANDTELCERPNGACRPGRPQEQPSHGPTASLPRLPRQIPARRVRNERPSRTRVGDRGAQCLPGRAQPPSPSTVRENQTYGGEILDTNKPMNSPQRSPAPPQVALLRRPPRIVRILILPRSELVRRLLEGSIFSIPRFFIPTHLRREVGRFRHVELARLRSTPSASF